MPCDRNIKTGLRPSGVQGQAVTAAPDRLQITVVAEGFEQAAQAPDVYVDRSCPDSDVAIPDMDVPS